MTTRGDSWCDSANVHSRAHACNCIGCCRKCGTCRTWPGHTPEYCALVVRQIAERLALLNRGAT